MTDLGTTNGTRIGGVRIVDARLEGGESITIGGTTLRLVRAGTLPDGPPARGKFGRVLGRSHEMQRVMALAERVVSSPLPMLLEGEAGTGKQLLAEAIHDGGTRALGPFVIFDASAHTGDEQLSLLFGREQPGAIEQASGGTLVIDEIGDLTEAAQARLVPVIERGQLQRVDASGSARVDVRILATTRRDVERLVQDGTFREELLYRLAGLRLEMPPLRARHGDVDLLARHFWTLYGGTGELPKSFALSLAPLRVAGKRAGAGARGCPADRLGGTTAAASSRRPDRAPPPRGRRLHRRGPRAEPRHAARAADRAPRVRDALRGAGHRRARRERQPAPPRPAVSPAATSTCSAPSRNPTEARQRSRAESAAGGRDARANLGVT